MPEINKYIKKFFMTRFLDTKFNYNRINYDYSAPATNITSQILDKEGLI